MQKKSSCGNFRAKIFQKKSPCAIKCANILGKPRYCEQKRAKFEKFCASNFIKLDNFVQIQNFHKNLKICQNFEISQQKFEILDQKFQIWGQNFTFLQKFEVFENVKQKFRRRQTSANSCSFPLQIFSFRMHGSDPKFFKKSLHAELFRPKFFQKSRHAFCIYNIHDQFDVPLVK